MPGATTGYMNVSQLPTDLAEKSFAAQIMRLSPNGAAPIFGIAGSMKTKTALQVQHGYWSKMMVFPEFQINNGAGYNAAATVFVVDTTANLLPGQVMENFRTKEQVLIISVDSGTQITVRRAVGSVVAAAINDDDYFPGVGNANEEGSNRPTASAILPESSLNLTQIFRNTWALTDTLRATMLIAGDGAVAENRKDCMLFHAADIEKALIFGQQYSGVLNNRPLRKMDGIVRSITAKAPGNITTAGGTTNYSQLEAALDPVFNYQSDPKMGNERVLFVGAQALKVINKVGRLSGQYHIVDGQTSFGLQFSSFKISRGTFRMIEHPLLNSNAQWAKMAIALDFSSLSLAYLTGRKTKAEEFGINGKYVENGQDAVGGSLTSELTLEMMNPYANGIIYNLTDGAAG